ncbi:MAG: hypothetical protein A3D92_13420 [Bacteroidetes bacterium RIFCSPHIGHO2_02_FULL_44_7]|nr:MAG: hypothetical protein A3D92_13420 [Bacteroidetes bacterium RIFCSPHIGHO2_02_FULL_44_7]
MKNSIGTLTLALLLAGLTFTRCSTPAEKVDDAKHNVEDANRDLEESKAYLKEMEAFRAQTEAQIKENERTIAGFKDRIADQRIETQEDYKKAIEALAVQNLKLRKRLNNFNADSLEAWKKFESEFKHDMEALGDAFHDFSVKNEQ